MPLSHQTPHPPGQTPADGAHDHRVCTWAPVWARPYLLLSRVDRPIGTWLLLLPCWWGLGLGAMAAQTVRPHDLWIALGCAVGACVRRGAGCTWNDIHDRDFDARVARTRGRPLPVGLVTPRQAMAWAVAQSLVGALILLTYNRTAIALGVGGLLLASIYPFAKRFTWWPQLFLGFAFNWGVLVAWAAHGGQPLATAPVLLYLSGVAWTVFYDTIYAHQDTRDDAHIGLKSTALLFGRATRAWLQAFAIVSVALMGAAIMQVLGQARADGGAGAPAHVLAFIGVAGFAAHLQWQLYRLDTDDPARCLRLFRANRIAGLWPALFFGAAAVV